MNVEVEWKVESTDEDITGSLSIHDFEDTNGEDYEVKIHVNGSSSQHKQARTAIANWESNLRKRLMQWREELLAHH